MRNVIGVLFLLAPALTAADPLPRQHTNLQRLSLDRLAGVHADVVKLKKERIEVPAWPGLTDFRCIMHAHAEDSAHTGGTLPEMIADAKKAGVHCVLLTDHFRPPADFMEAKRRGLRDGVLLIPGSEVRGFLIYPMNSILNRMELKTPDFIPTVTDGDGMIFLSHIEERKDHSLDGLTGLEIYNRHWDAKRDAPSYLALIMMMTDPKQLADLQKALELYPEELLGFQCDYPNVYLDKWDEGSKTKRLTGVAANDCHHNQILLVKMVDAETVLVGTNVDKDEQMRRVSVKLRPGIREMTKDHKPGDVLAKLDLDPYHRSFRNSSTHILAAKLGEAEIRTALKSGRVYVAHDWMADPTGFRFEAVLNDQKLGIMGDEVKRTEGLKLTAQLPVPATIRLLRHGQVVAQADGKRDFHFPVTTPGSYRLEAWLTLDGEPRPWIYSNAIAVK